MKTSLFLIGSLCLTLANAALPVLYRVDQPNSNVVVFRGAQVAQAQAAGLLPGGPAKASPPVAKPTPAPYVAPTTPYVPPPPPTTTPPPPPPTTAKPAPPPTPVYRPAPTPAYRPAPIIYHKPAPTIVYKPAPPVVYKPVPKVVYKPAPAPAYKPAPATYAPAYANVDPNYTWEYNVDDAHYSHFGHKESRDHYLATGVYYVNLPDGRTQTVTYTADENGYRPVVTYDGEAKYPELVVPKAGYAA